MKLSNTSYKMFTDQYPAARRTCRQMLMSSLLVLVSMLVCFPASAIDLTGISYTSLPGDKVQVKLGLSEAPTGVPLSFTIDNPARIALDFPATHLKVPNRNETIGIGVAHSVAAVEAGGRTRVVLNLVRMVPYDVKVEGNAVYVTLESSGAADVAMAAGGSSKSMASTQAASASEASLESIDFHRAENGAGRVVVKLSDPSINVNMHEEGGRILVDFINTALPEALNRRLDVVDFATPVKEIDTTVQGNNVHMVITPTGEYEQLAYQTDNTLTIEVKPLTKEEVAARKKKEFSGERLSLNFQNIEVRAVLQLIADFTGLNLVASDTVTGNVTLRLKNVPWDQAMDIILKSKGLAMRRAGNVIMVAPQEEIAAREKLELESQKQIAELAPLKTEFIQINYAKATDLSTLIKAKENNLLSERGNISLDERTNTLLVQDTAEKLAEIRKLIEKLDIPVRQVMISSRIVIANDDFSKDLGVRFGYSKNTSQASQARGHLFSAIGGRIPGDTDFGGTTSFNTNNNENYIVNLPVTGPAGALGFAIGKIGSYLLQLELTALQKEGRGEVISSPRVITANQKEAVIEQGTEIPYQEASSSGSTSVSFKKAVLSLRVTPQITPDDRIIMDLKVSKDAVGTLFAGVPSIDTQNVDTQVLVDNGETVVLGGVYTQEKRDDSSRVPFFGDLPYIGYLFKNTSKSKTKKELLIFVTPKILKEGVALN